MEAEAALHLFESFWFHLVILEKKQPKTSTPTSSRQQIQHEISKSNHLPNLKIEIPSLNPSLQTILSHGEMASSETPKYNPKQIKVVHRRKKQLSKSLSELEFDEVKGFIDLGFVFSGEDADSDLVEIIPGLQKLGHEVESRDRRDGEIVEARGPYLSEAWEFRQKEEKTMMEWRVSAARNEMEMKESLRLWAHAVASAVR